MLLFRSTSLYSIVLLLTGWLLCCCLPCVAQTADDYVVIGDQLDLHAGDTVIIVNPGCTYALGVEQNSNNRAAVPVTMVDGRLMPDNDVQRVVLEQWDRFWLLRVGEGLYLHAAGTAANNFLRTTATAEAQRSGICTISLEQGEAVVEFQRTEKSESTKFLAFNPGSSFNAPLFACYDGENVVYLFRKARYTSAGISTTTARDGTVHLPVYDLQGRRYGTDKTLRRGIYLRGGKKMVVE
ncbi:MAG: hypothetical protein J6I60_07950 [Bacteroidaceae bacterium]|nr:hypothetical protein [Bacteroidaceae bacterium]